MFHSFVFDWSGTLANDLPPVLECTNRLLGKHGRPPMDESTFRDMFRLPFKGFYDEVLPEVPLEELEEQYAAFFTEARSPVTLLPHAVDFLDFCRNQGCRMFILSSARMNFLVDQARMLGVHDYFEEIHAGVVDKRAALPEILSRHGLDPETTAFVGDMEHDIEAAHAAGVHGIGVLTGYDSAAKLARARPEIVVSHLGKLRRLLSHRPGPPPARTTVQIRGLRLSCHIGVPDEERATPQELHADLDLVPAITNPGQGDDIARTIDYHQVCLQMRDLAAAKPRQLVETLAAEMIDALRLRHPVAGIRVALRKFVLDFTNSVGVTMDWGDLGDN